jgi:DNA-directed RNA polymerase specialized sigma24 family protein
MSKQEMAAARAEITELIEEGWETLRRMPDRERDLLLRGERGQQWPQMVHSAAEHAAWKPMRSRRPPPTAKQIDRMHEVMDLLLALAKQDRDFAKAVWLCCAMRRRTGEAAKLLGAHRDTVRVWRDNGLDRLHRLRARRLAA